MSLIQSSFFTSYKVILNLDLGSNLDLNTQNSWISIVHRDIHPNPAERKESMCKKK